MTESKHYDLIVIGGGSGMRVMSAAANDWGWKVALVEEGPLGGTCLNRGCIPSKILIHTADLIEDIKNAGKFGVDARVDSVDFKKVMARANTFVDCEAEDIEKGVTESANIDFYKMRGEFTGDKTIRVGNETISADRILISAGTRPTVPPIEGLADVAYITSTEALRLQELPKSMIIIGGGYIAAELGHFYGTLGTKVTIVETADMLVAREDKEIARAFTEIFSGKHTVLLGYKVTKVAEEAGLKNVTVQGADGAQKTLEAETLLLTVGRRPNTDILALENTGVKVSEKGYIEVNEFMETSVPGVWALGDIVGKAPFKHGANYEARHVIENMREGGAKKAVDYAIMPHAIFSSPQIAGVGLTEEEAREKGVRYEVRRREYKKTGFGKAIEEDRGFVKYLIDPDGDTILGCHIMGPHAAILIHEVVVAMSAAGGKASAIRDAIHINPALSELVQWAL